MKIPWLHCPVTWCLFELCLCNAAPHNLGGVGGGGGGGGGGWKSYVSYIAFALSVVRIIINP